MSGRRGEAIPSAALLRVTGGAFALAALGYNEFLLEALAGSALDPRTLARVRHSQLGFLAAGCLLLALALGVSRLRGLAWLAGPRAANWLLAGIALAAPLAAAELALRPLVQPPLDERTRLFERDPELGWRMRPGITARWFGSEIEVNAKGLRGPELPYAKPAGTQRILWLGDSVAIGFRLESWRQSFPYLVEASLERGPGLAVETVNGAVDGYSPWQHAAWLAREGHRYDPDLVIVCFVLNDVTEKLDLVRFGGSGEGFQLAHAATWLDRLLGDSAILHYARAGLARLRFGADPQRGARERQRLDVETLAREPERADVRAAWERTLDELREIFDFCRARGIRGALVVFPFTFQFLDVKRLSAPQRVLERFARERGLPHLDLLPPLRRRIQREGAKLSDWFLDEDHPSARGHEVAAELIHAFVEREGLLARAPAPPGSLR